MHAMPAAEDQIINPKTCSFQDALVLGSELCRALEDGDESKNGSITAILSHSNGIRGFFVNYLTDESLNFPEKKLPPVIMDAHGSNSMSRDFLRIIKMNFIMPTAMVVTHAEQNNEVALESSEVTARRAATVLWATASVSSTVREEVSAARVAASGDIGNKDPIVEFWKRFYSKWGYGETHLVSISESLSKGAQVLSREV